METEGVVVVLGENKDIEAPLDREEESRLADLEEQIETAINAIGKRFYQIGMALVSINEQRLYRAYGTFDRYCETKWHFTRQRVYQLMNSAKEMDKLYQAQTPSGNSSHFVFGEEVLFDAIDGKNVKNFLHQMKESHLHELKGLSVEAKFEVYDEACRTSPPGQLRARHVKEIRAALYPEPIPDWGKNEKGKIKRKQLLEALDAVLPGVATSDKQMTGPNAFSYLDSFVFDDKWLKSYNGKICVSYPLDTGLVGAVAAKEFYSV
ncbi:MAG: hypothetical protein ABSC19_20225, partial [Syntrophorhabdales bacterium]